MEKEFQGVIPLNTELPKFVCPSIGKIIAVGVGHSVYVIDNKVSENIARINHYPHFANCGVWNTKNLNLITADSGGFVIVSNIKDLTSTNFFVMPEIIGLEFHFTSDLLFVMNNEKIVVWDFTQERVLQEIGVHGLKIVLDFFVPQKIVVIDKSAVKVIRNFNKSPKVFSGYIENVVDGVMNPSMANSIFLLTDKELLVYDTGSLTVVKVLNTFSVPMIKIMSFYSNEVWTLAKSGVFSHNYSFFPLEFEIASGSPNIVNGKLQIHYVTSDLELCSAVLSSAFEVVSKISLGISLDLWSFGYLFEKVLVFYCKKHVFCFSFTKERPIRKVKTGKIQKMVCFESNVYMIQGEKALIEWKMNTGEIKILKTYEEKLTDLSINTKGSLLSICTSNFLEIFEISSSSILFRSLSLTNTIAMVWAEEENLLYISTVSQFCKVYQETSEDKACAVFASTVLASNSLTTTEIFENSGEIYLKTSGTWLKYCPETSELIPDPIVKIDEINIGHNKAEFKDFGLLYRDSEKALIRLNSVPKSTRPNEYELDSLFLSSPTKLLFESPQDSLVSRLIMISEQENNIRNYLFWKIVKESIENKFEDPEETNEDKNRARIKERSLQNSPGNITPTRRPVKRSVSPINKSRKSITPQRMHKMQTDPKDLIQLAVDTSSLLSSTQNIPKEVPPKLYYILENSANLKQDTNSVADFLSNDKKLLVKKLQNSSEEMDLLLACVIAGTLGKQELVKCLEIACSKIGGVTGIKLNLALGSRSKAFEILAENECHEDIAYFSRLSGRIHDFFTWVIHLYEENFAFESALNLFAAGYTGLCLQILCKVHENRLAHWLLKCLDGNCKNKKEVPGEFEAWFYEIGAPRFKSKCDEDLKLLSALYEKMRVCDN